MFTRHCKEDGEPATEAPFKNGYGYRRGARHFLPGCSPPTLQRGISKLVIFLNKRHCRLWVAFNLICSSAHPIGVIFIAVPMNEGVSPTRACASLGIYGCFLPSRLMAYSTSADLMFTYTDLVALVKRRKYIYKYSIPFKLPVRIKWDCANI